MVTASNLGFPRIGAFRELKKAVEGFWKGNITEEALYDEAANIRATNWKKQQDAGIAHIPSNDFAFYDQVLNTIAMVGAVPARYNWTEDTVSLDTYFQMARGKQADGVDVTAMEMTKWFDTNYHYIVPEFTKATTFKQGTNEIVRQFLEAKEQGVVTRPVLLGPVSFLLLGKSYDETEPLSLLDSLLPVYVDVLKQLAEAGAQWVQIDEPTLVLDQTDEARAAYTKAFDVLSSATDLKILVATYFERLGENLDTAVNLPVDALHIDVVRAPEQLDDVLAALPADKSLSVGVIDGRNIWKADLAKAEATIAKAVDKLGSDRVLVAPSCSLLHTPVDLDSEDKLDAEIKDWMAFATQKLTEIAKVADAANGNKDEDFFAANAASLNARASSPLVHNEAVKARVAAEKEADKNRKSNFDTRAAIQREELGLPALPTTTIGSFPQTQEVRAARAKFKKGEISRAQYDQFLEEETTRCIRIQEDLDIDVLVHGEFERNDMVEYFGEKLEGFVFSKFGWVQSYGSRCVKPPIIFGDVSRPEAMTVRWSSFAQNQTERYMKGMLTGPVTILQWSFVRNDQPEEDTCKQISWAIRDETVDLEKAGIKIIQIDEAALREGLPLRRGDWAAYLKWAVDSFRITASGVEDNTQIHTHMCYSEFNDIIEAVADMDADVISIETSRSAMELLDAFVQFEYPNEIGPGVYDIHSPRVPAQSEMETLLTKALDVLTPEQVWVNPDCGLKTRGWAEVKPALAGMVAAAKSLRKELANKEAA